METLKECLEQKTSVNQKNGLGQKRGQSTSTIHQKEKKSDKFRLQISRYGKRDQLIRF
jgi:hypothetical protein